MSIFAGNSTIVGCGSLLYKLRNLCLGAGVGSAIRGVISSLLLPSTVQAEMTLITEMTEGPGGGMGGIAPVKIYEATLALKLCKEKK